MKKLLPLVLLLLNLKTYSQINLGSGLAASYSFTGNANDESGNGFNGTVSNASLTTDRFSNDNSAYQFGKANDYINMGNVLNSVFAGADKKFSISMWIKPDQLMNNNCLVMKVSDYACSENERQFYYRIFQGKLLFSYNTNSTQSGNGYSIFGSTNITNYSKWYHLVLTYDGSIKTGNFGINRIKMYVDNIAEQTSVENITGTLGDIPSGNAPLAVGQYLSTQNSPCSPTAVNFFGKIDDIKIYDRLLTTDEINALYAEVISDLTSAYLEKNVIISNPVSDELRIELTDDVKVNKLEIVNLLGNVLIKKELTSQSIHQVNTRDLTSGYYLLVFTTEKGERLVKRISKF